MLAILAMFARLFYVHSIYVNIVYLSDPSIQYGHVEVYSDRGCALDTPQTQRMSTRYEIGLITIWFAKKKKKKRKRKRKTNTIYLNRTDHETSLLSSHFQMPMQTWRV